jgi:hypothetical protein
VIPVDAELVPMHPTSITFGLVVVTPGTVAVETVALLHAWVAAPSSTRAPE